MLHIALLLVTHWLERWCLCASLAAQVSGLYADLFALFVARDCYEGIRTCNLWVRVLIGSYRRAIVGGTPEFLGQLIALLLVAHWLERWCASLAAQVRFLACLVQRQLLQGGT